MKTFIIALALISTNVAHAACTVYHDSGSALGCRDSYLGEQLALAGLTIESDLTKSDFQIGFKREHTEDAKGDTYSSKLVAYDHRSGGLITAEALITSKFYKYSRNRQQQQQQQTGSYRCKNKDYADIQTALHLLLSQIQRVCNSAQ